MYLLLPDADVSACCFCVCSARNPLVRFIIYVICRKRCYQTCTISCDIFNQRFLVQIVIWLYLCYLYESHLLNAELGFTLLIMLPTRKLNHAINLAILPCDGHKVKAVGHSIQTPMLIMISQGIIRSFENIGKIYQRTHIFLYQYYQYIKWCGQTINCEFIRTYHFHPFVLHCNKSNSEC